MYLILKAIYVVNITYIMLEDLSLPIVKILGIWRGDSQTKTRPNFTMKLGGGCPFRFNINLILILVRYLAEISRIQQ